MGLSTQACARSRKSGEAALVSRVLVHAIKEQSLRFPTIVLGASTTSRHRHNPEVPHVVQFFTFFHLLLLILLVST